MLTPEGVICHLPFAICHLSFVTCHLLVDDICLDYLK
jgi:hypothetical protein